MDTFIRKQAWAERGLYQKERLLTWIIIFLGDSLGKSND